jgi:hypothetical protein
MALFSLLPIVGMYFGLRGTFWVKRKTPNGLKLAQYYTMIVRMQTQKISQKLAVPVIRSYGEEARAEAVLRGLAPQKKKPPVPVSGPIMEERGK